MNKNLVTQNLPYRKLRLRARCAYKGLRSQRGTTLVESLIAGLLSLVVGGALIALVTTTYSFSQHGHGRKSGVTRHTSVPGCPC